MPNIPDPQWAPTFVTPTDREYDYTDGEKCIELANLAFSTLPTPYTLDGWQEWLLKEVLARDTDTGRYRYRSFVISMGRQ